MLARNASLVLAAVLLLGAAPVLAQGDPTAGSIIESLRPRPGTSGGLTRGIRPIAPTDSTAQGGIAASPRAGAAGPGRHAAAPAARPAEPAAPSVNLTVQFANDSAELTPAAMRTLDELGRALTSQTLSSYRFRIEGHTDSLGTHEHNKVLSEQRANRVLDYLSSKFGLDRARLEAVGMGEDRPLVPARAKAAEPRNRRVTVINLGA